MKKVRKLLVGTITVCAAAALAFALAGCGGSSSDSNDEAAASDYELLEDGTLTVGTSPDYPPFENLVDDEIVGFEVDLMEQVAAKLDLKVEYKSMQFDTILPAVVSGGQIDVGMSGFSVTPERSKEIDFTDTIFTDDMAVAVMKGGQITSDNAREALNKKGVTIAVQTGTTGETYAKENFPNATIKGFGSSNDIFAAMQADKADAACTNLSVVSDMLKEAYSDAEIVLKDASDEDYAFIVSQDNPGLTEAINGALEELQNDGTLDELTEKWFSA